MARPHSSESVFRALAHEQRRRIVLALRGGDSEAGKILPPGEVSRPAISQHLRILREARLVEFRKVGPRLVYRLNVAALRPLEDLLARLRGGSPRR